MSAEHTWKKELEDKWWESDDTKIIKDQPLDIVKRANEGIIELGEEVVKLRSDNVKLLKHLNHAHTQLRIVEDAVKMVKTLSAKEVSSYKYDYYTEGPDVFKDKPLILTEDMEIKNERR